MIAFFMNQILAFSSIRGIHDAKKLNDFHQALFSSKTLAERKHLCHYWGSVVTHYSILKNFIT